MFVECVQHDRCWAEIGGWSRHSFCLNLPHKSARAKSRVEIAQPGISGINHPAPTFPSNLIITPLMGWPVVPCNHCAFAGLYALVCAVYSAWHALPQSLPNPIWSPFKSWLIWHVVSEVCVPTTLLVGNGVSWHSRTEGQVGNVKGLCGMEWLFLGWDSLEAQDCGLLCARIAFWGVWPCFLTAETLVYSLVTKLLVHLVFLLTWRAGIVAHFEDRKPEAQEFLFLATLWTKRIILLLESTKNLGLKES